MNVNNIAGLQTLAHNISDYKIICFFISKENVTFESCMYPASFLPSYVSEQNAVAVGIDVMRINVRLYGIATYKADNKLYIQTNCSLAIYGWK